MPPLICTKALKRRRKFYNIGHRSFFSFSKWKEVKVKQIIFGCDRDRLWEWKVFFSKSFVGRWRPTIKKKILQSFFFSKQIFDRVEFSPKDGVDHRTLVRLLQTEKLISFSCFEILTFKASHIRAQLERARAPWASWQRSDQTCRRLQRPRWHFRHLKQKMPKRHFLRRTA